MNIQNAYNDWSNIYDTNENLTRDLDAKVTREIFAGQRFESILETGCGTGKNTAFFAQIGAQVHALDFSQGMIDKAKEKVHAEHVRFSTADLNQRWPCHDEEYDLVSCNLVLEHIADLTHIFSEATRVLKPGGKFFINELHPFKQYGGTKARFERGAEIIEVDAFTHHISEFIQAGTEQHFTLSKLNEFWHEEDQGKPPRLVSFLFEKE